MAWPTFLTPHAEPVTYQWIRWLWISSCLSISTVDILVIIWFVTKSSLKSIPPFSPEFLFLTVCGRWPKILHCPLTPRILIWRRSSFFVVLFYFVLFFIIIISWLSKKRDCHLYSTPFRFIQAVLASTFEPSGFLGGKNCSVCVHHPKPGEAELPLGLWLLRDVSVPVCGDKDSPLAGQ